MLTGPLEWHDPDLDQVGLRHLVGDEAVDKVCAAVFRPAMRLEAPDCSSC